MRLRRARLVAPALIRARGTFFNPLTSVSGDGPAYWAEGPKFVALGYSDGALVGTWPDELGTRDLPQSTEADKPIYSATGFAGGRPCVRSVSADWLQSASFTAIAQPLTIVTVLASQGYSPSATRYLFDGALADQVTLFHRVTNELAGNAGVQLNTGAGGDALPHLIIMTVNGASSDIEIDSTSHTGNLGTNSLSGVTLFRRADGDINTTNNGKVSFWRCFDRVLTDAEKQQYRNWAFVHYS